MSNQPDTPARKGGIGTAAVALIVLVVGIGVGGGAFWWARRGAAPPSPVETRASDHGIVAFEPFVVNLADPNASRFLRATVQVVVPSAEAAEHILTTPVVLMQARSSILEVLTQQTSDAIGTPDGKAALKQAIAEHVAPVFDEVKVVDVLFSDFVIQF
ncbi:MAG: flagellar basal body-associated FliL family protein [Acidobacteria bacterium]|nr:flagellar basal body-associated FliL family protein [Acidobacteriota bacterium]